MKKIASIILICQNGKIALQHRDDIPTITSPGMYSVFGGGVEDEETFEQAAIREIKEETDLDITENDLKKFLDIEDYFDQKSYRIFVVENVDQAKLTILEGQGIVYLSVGDDLTKVNKLSANARYILYRYIKHAKGMQV